MTRFGGKATPSPPNSLCQAAERLIHNHEAVAAFAARGAGLPGFPPVMAELADPRAKPAGPEVVAAVDRALRSVAQALLDGPDAVTAFPPPTPALQKSLTYLQQRVGVPRDMSYAAARQLRGHLGWLMGAMVDPPTVGGAAGASASAAGVLYAGEGPTVTMYTTAGCTLCDKVYSLLCGVV